MFDNRHGGVMTDRLSGLQVICYVNMNVLIRGDWVFLSKITDVELIGASVAAKLLGVNKNKIYELWKENELTWWCIGGTKKTTKEAVP